MQADRRRLNPPPGGTTPPIFAPLPTKRPQRTRPIDEHRKLFLQTGVVPSASGSAYFEIPPPPPGSKNDQSALIVPSSSNLKLTCTVHGPRALPRTAAFSPNLLLTAHVKFAPFATRHRRGYVRDAGERDLAVHLETALRGAVIADRWPKSACDVVITVLEGEEDRWWGESGVGGGGSKPGGGWGVMNVLAGCITVASAALVDAGIDCVDLVSGGVAAIDGEGRCLLDPSPSEHDIKAACVVGYLQSRDEVTEMWLKGDLDSQTDDLVSQAVKAATMTRTVLVEAIKEATEMKLVKFGTTGGNEQKKAGAGNVSDVAMTG